MSRRIAYCALATAIVLIAAPAKADRECFENSCRMPDVIEPQPAAAVPVAPEAAENARAQAQAPAPAETGGTARADAAPADAPAGLHPQMVVDPRPRQPAKVAPRRTVKDNVDVGPARFPTAPAPRYPKVAKVPAKPAGEAPAVARARPALAPAPVHAAVEGTAPARAVIVQAPGIIHVEPGVAPAYAILRPDPALRVCQIDEGGHADRIYYCGPHSYHPFGAYGYRPYGSYRSYGSAPAYVLAPNAKIISIDSGD